MTRDLTALFDPADIVVIGASSDPAKWGNAVAVQALRGAGRHRVHLVNRRGGHMLGHPMLRSTAELDSSVDLAVIAVPEAGFEAAVDDALAQGARAIVAITAGLGEAGTAGRTREESLIARVRAAGAVLVGPNCLGVVDNTTSTYLSSNQFARGDIAVLSQSGNLAIELDRLFVARGLGISRFVSLGNQADVTLVELIGACASDPATSAIALYVEDFRDGRGFVTAAAAAVAAGTPVVVLAAGSGMAAARGAQSHTGSLTSDTAVIAAGCSAAGAVVVRTPRELADVLLALRQPAFPRGRRVAVLTDGGGHGVIACDVAEAAGLVIPALSETTQDRLRDALWTQSHVSNPVDLAGAGEKDPASYARAFAVLQACEEVDAVLMTGYFGGYSSGEDGLTGLGPAECSAAKQIAADAATKPTAVQSIFPDAPACRILSDATVPVYAAIEDAAGALCAVASPRPAPGLIELPCPGVPVGDTDYFASRNLLTGIGIEFVQAREIATAPELEAAADELDGPYVLKALGLLHKSDAGGVVVGVETRADLLAAHAELHGRLNPASFSVEEMADLSVGVELIVGAQWDPRFGPTVLVGMGGTATEVLRDVAVALAPVTEAQAHLMLRRLRTAPLLGSYRGRPAVDMRAAARVVALVSDFIAAQPDIAELDINPLFVSPSGATALDARIITRT